MQQCLGHDTHPNIRFTQKEELIQPDILLHNDHKPVSGRMEIKKRQEIASFS